MDITQLCFVCEEKLTSAQTVVVKKRGIKTCIASSIKRKDNKDKFLTDVSSITVHDLCRKSYNQEQRILAAVKLLDSPSTSRSRRDQGFDFKNKCLFCANDASEEYIQNETKKAVDRRDLVNNVSTLSFRDTILTGGRARNDDWGREVIQRIENVIDLVAADGRYHRSCFRRFQIVISSDKPRGRPGNPEIAKVVEFISNFIEKNEEECQFSLRDIVREYEGEIPCEKSIKQKLLDKYGDNIIMTSNVKKDPIICFRNVGHKLLADSFYKKRNKDIQEERLRVVREAANVIIEDIRSQVYETDNYPSPHQFLNNVETDVPDTLRVLLDTVILKNKKGTPARWTPKIISIAHAIIAAARPRSFISSLQVGLGSVLNRKFGSKLILNLLASLGFSVTYEEAILFETSAIMSPQSHIMSDAFMQFVFDNADHNVGTLDGLNTFHAMGGIQCVTPNSSVVTQGTIPRLKKLPSAQNLGAYGTVSLRTFQKQAAKGLNAVEIKNLTELNPIDNEIRLLPTDSIWLYGKWKTESQSLPGWNGFMKKITFHLQYSTSRIIFLPFINAPPSNYDTIYTALLEASNKCIQQNQKVCFVTFDQPLYHKARDIIASCSLNSDSCRIIVRLGGFHLLMSFLGAIGFIMDGSGLKELLSIVYAASSVDKMLTGHAYARAVRGHLLVHLALAKIILSNTDISVDDQVVMEDIYCEPHNILKKSQSEDLGPIMNKFTETLNRLANNGATAKLWSQYFKMITLVKQFIQAERTGNWLLHLECIQKMLPFFHATGHLLYAKTCQLYLQDMLQLESKLSPTEYDLFVKQGFFTVRRSDKFWTGGIWTDMTIEQTLMKDSKSRGGFTHGRGTTESVLGKWVLEMPTITEVTDKIGNFCNVDFATTEQHVDARPTRLSRDDEDVQKFIDWFRTHPPFPEMAAIMSLSTGVRGDESINCHDAQDIGLSLMEKVVGKNFGDVKLARNSRVQPLSNANSSMKIHNETVSVNPLFLLFQRIALVKKSEEELQNYFTYELAPYPLSLFDDQGMRKTTKSTLYDCFTPSNIPLSAENFIHVVDGGYLLHRVLWQQNETYDEITNKYVEYVQRCFKPHSIIVFDGYPEDALMTNTKYAERLRRQQKQTCAEVFFDITMHSTVSQDKFLSNDKNKNRLIQLLSNKLGQAGFICKQAYEDADTLIVTTALEASRDYDAAVIVGEDVDLLAIMTGLNSNNPKVYFLKPSKGKMEQRLYSYDSFKYPTIRNYILFLRAFSGCDTTSAFFRMGKKKFVKLLHADEDLQIILSPFLCADSHPDFLDCSAQKFIVALYGGKKDQRMYLDEMRFHCFSKSSSKNSFNLASLPPTREAARQHALRVYQQVQSWQGNHLTTTDWGWKRSANGLLPITTDKAVIPEGLLKIICCKCEKGCAGGCGYRKVGLRCSNICANCQGRTCTNIDVDVDIDENVDEQVDIDMDNFLSAEVEFSDGEDEDELLLETDNDHSPLLKRRRLED